MPLQHSEATNPALKINGENGGPNKKKHEVNESEMYRYKNTKCVLLEGFLLIKV